MKMKILPCRGLPLRHKVRWTFTDVRLTGHTLTYPNVLLHTNDQLVLPLHEKTMSLGFGTQYERGDMTFEPSLSAHSSVCETPVFFFVYNTDNYFHFLYDTLPYLLHYFALPKGTKLLMNPTTYPFVLDCLDLLGLSESDIVYTNPDTLYKTVYVGNSLTHDGLSNHPPHPEVYSIYQRMRDVACKTPTVSPKKLYISRRSWIHGDLSNMGTNYTTRRKMTVETELVDKLASKGYTEVFCETMTMKRKIQMFANATHVVGAIGGGMCNLVFANPDCKVVSINSPEFDSINQRFLFTMNHTNLTQFRNTHKLNNLYRRVSVGDRIGEVQDERGDRVCVAFSSGITWKHDIEYDYTWIPVSSVTYLDNGLNSPWYFDVEECMALIQ
jgi:hypothetical protein